MSRFSWSRPAAMAAAALFISPVYAHVTLAEQHAPVESSYRAVLRVPHGCKGSPTVKVRVRIPEGVIGVKPQPKPGWTLDTVKGDYARSYRLYHGQVSSGVKEITWSGGRLPDDHYDEFVFISYLSGQLTPGATVYFPVVQECESGVERWIDVPGADGKPTETPAPGLKLLPKQP